MLIKEVHELARALQPLMKDQVVVRYAVEKEDGITFDAELAALVYWEGSDYLTRVIMSAHVHRRVEITSNFEVINLDEQTKGIHDMCTRWSRRSFDDWLHNKPFMGAYGVFRNGQAYTSIKFEASDARWRFLTGILIGELGKFQLATAPEDYANVTAVTVMKGRFSAFAAKNELVFANKEFSAR